MDEPPNDPPFSIRINPSNTKPHPCSAHPIDTQSAES